MGISVISVLFFTNLAFAVEYSSNARPSSIPSCEYHGRKLVCGEIIDPSFVQDVPESAEVIVFTSDNLACDCTLKSLIEWKETLPRSRTLSLEGLCFSPDHPSGISINNLSSKNIPCGSGFEGEVLVRKRRAVDEGQNETRPTANRTYSPGAPVLPCDFEEGFCQWIQLVDDEFHWTRNKGPTSSFNTGPDVDHTTGTVNGSYIYIEASLPRRPFHTARLVGPTLAAVEPNSTCQMDLYIHMKGSDIGTLNIYQAPVDDFAIKKLSLSNQQGQNWFNKKIQFDSDTEFQVIIEGVRGYSYQGDIAIDDITFTSGCKRLVPSYVRLTGGSTFHDGRAEIYRQGVWGPVCKDGWSQEDSSVACREMGFAKALPGVGGGSPLTGLFTGLYNVSCSGNETSIKNCPAGAWSNNTSCPSNYSATVDCSGILPVCPLRTHLYCPVNSGGNKTCISHAQLCDFTKDCWDGSDELNCDNYTRCDFNDTGLCGWIQAQNDQMDWTRHSGPTPSILTGPSADHTGNPNAYYLYMEVSNRQGGEKARILVTPRFQGNNNGLCKLRFYYHMYGPGIGTLRVIAAGRYSRRTLWSKTYSQNVDWTRAEVQLANMSTSFIVTFEGEHSPGYSPLGDISIDDVSFTPECRPAPHENVTCTAETFPCGTGECIPLSLQCDFNDDCFDGTDENNCGLHTPGHCDFEADLCHWQNMTDDKFDWQRHSGNTPSAATGPMYDHTRGFGGNGYYLYIEASSPRVYGDIARLISPQFMWKNVANCKLRFYYHMQGLWSNTMGRLRVRLRNTITGAESDPLWERFGHQGTQWNRADVPINTSWPVTQVIFEAERGLSYRGDMAIDDVSFSTECYPSEAVHIYKNYDVRLAEGKEGSFEGRVEVYRVGTWGTICDDGWGTNDANVVCKQLGYAGVKSVHPNAYFGQGKGQIWLDDLACVGNETNLGQCMHNGWGSHDCTHSKDAGVVCDKDGGSTTKAVRLHRNNGTRSGQVEIYHSGSWEAICYDNWDVHDAFVACRQLGFAGADGITREAPGSTPNALRNVQCNGNENTLGDCVHSWSLGSCSYGYAGVICTAQGTAEGNIRLSGGSSKKEGRIEVFHQGEWGTVCDDGWHERNARVVCYELGFTSARKALQSFGPGSGRVWLDRVNCDGSETALVNCPHAGWGVTSCRHQEDVGVICSDDAYVGCYKDTNAHVMKHEITAPSMTPVKCIRRCQIKGYSYAGLEWANECYCGEHYDRYGNATSCDLPCLGDTTKVCGGAWALSVYNTDPAIIPNSVPGHAAVTQSCTKRSYFIFFTFNTRLTDRYYGGDHRSGWISTPRFPTNYQDRTVCIWVLTLLPGTRVKINFKSFITESHYDYVEIRDGEKDYSQPFLTPTGGFSGNHSYSVTASSNVMWIKFYSDSSVNRQGFNLTYQALGAPTLTPPPTPIASTTISPFQLPAIQFIEGGCNGGSDTVNKTFGYFDWYHNTGYVQSPGYPSNYDNNLVCRWSIRVAPGFRIIATVKQADIAHAAESGGLGDTLHVDDGITVKRSHEHSVPWDFLSNGSLVRVLFITDAMNSGKGFYLSYERVNVTEGASSTASVPIITSIAQTVSSQMAPSVKSSQTLTSAVPVSSSAIQPTSSSVRVSSSGERPTTPGVENTFAPRKGDKDHGMGGGIVALIVVLTLLVIVLGALLLFCLVKRKKRSIPGVSHGFVNAAYGESMDMTPTVNGSSEYEQPIISNGTHAPPQARPGREPGVYLSAAPPPYQAPSGGVYLVPFAPAPVGIVPVGIDNPGYATLYADPPAYEATARVPATGTTTTGIGSVTSLREAARDDGVAAPASTVTPAAMFPPISRAALPPIRGTHGAADQAKKQLPQEDEAGPLPEKPPLTVNTPPEPTAPSRPPSASSQLRVVSPVSLPEQEFNTEVPFEFLCPITNKIMTDPVTAADGYTYEHRAIRRWFRKKRTSPMTNKELIELTVRGNDELRKRIETFKAEHTEV